MELNAARFFIEKSRIGAGEIIDEITIEGDDARHIRVVLRKAAGDHIFVCDGAGTDYVCKLTYVGQDGIRAAIVESYPSIGEPPIKVILFQSLLKSDRFEYVLQKCTEAGIHEIVPVMSGRVQFAAGMEGDGGAKRLERWRKIIYAAAKQSGRGILPKLGGCIGFSGAVAACAERIKASPEQRLALIPYENEEKTSLKSKLKVFKQSLNAINHNVELNVFIGPEGGYTPEEIRLCRQNVIAPVSLGPRIFRAETAGLAVLCQIMYEFEQ